MYGQVVPAHFKVTRLQAQPTRPPRWGEGLHAHLDLELQAQSAVFTGSGLPEFSHDRRALVAGFLTRPRRNGDPAYIIGGAGVKGALRAVVEAITPSCDRGCRGSELCPACEWFGSTTRRGAVWCSDAVLTEGRIVDLSFPQRYSGKDLGGRRFYGLDSEQSPATQSETVEAVEAGAVFTASIALRGISPAGAGAITITLGLGPKGLPVFRLGGAKNRGFGIIKVQLRGGWWVDKFADIAIPERHRPISDQVLATWQDAWAKAYPQGAPVLETICTHYTRRGGR